MIRAQRFRRSKRTRTTCHPKAATQGMSSASAQTPNLAHALTTKKTAVCANISGLVRYSLGQAQPEDSREIDSEKNDLESALERYWDAEDELPTPLVKALGVYMRRLIGDELMTYGLLGQSPSGDGRTTITTTRSVFVPIYHFVQDLLKRQALCGDLTDTDYRTTVMARVTCPHCKSFLPKDESTKTAIIRSPGTPLWLERWKAEGKCIIAVYESEGAAGYGVRAEVEVSTVREMIAGLPLYIQALLDAEVNGEGVCGGCDYDKIDKKGHQTGCSIDRALVAAGLKTGLERFDARKLLAAWRLANQKALEKKLK